MPTARWKPAVDGVRRALAHLATTPLGRPSADGGVRPGADPGRRTGPGRRPRPGRRASPTPTGAATSARAATRSGDRAGLSGYARYDRIASNADIAGWLLWRNFRVETSLDVGCATGFLVEVLRERGIEAEGCDVSQFAVDHAAPGAVGHVRVANLFAGLPWPDRAFELVTALEILEHLPPDRVPDRPGRAPPGLRRVSLRHHPLVRPQPVGTRRTLRGQGAPRAGGPLPRPRARLPRSGARGGPGSRCRGQSGRGPPDHRLVRVVDRAVRSGRVHPLPRRRAPSVRRHRAGRPGPVLEHLRLQGRRCARCAGRAPVPGPHRLPNSGSTTPCSSQ